MLAIASDSVQLAWPLRTVSGSGAVRAKVRLRFATLQGERPDDLDSGLPYSWMFGETPTPTEVQIGTRNQLRQITEVEQVGPVVAVKSGASISVSASLTIRTIDGLEEITVGEPLPYDTRGAPAWYMTSGLIQYGRGPAWQGA